MLGRSLQTDIIKDLAAKIINHILWREEILLVSLSSMSVCSSDLRNFDRTFIASMVSLFSLYRTKWQKVSRFLGQKCFLGALIGTQKKVGLYNIVHTFGNDSRSSTADLLSKRFPLKKI